MRYQRISPQQRLSIQPHLTSFTSLLAILFLAIFASTASSSSVCCAFSNSLAAPPPRQIHRLTHHAAVSFQYQRFESSKITVRRLLSQQNLWDSWEDDDAFVHEADELLTFLVNDEYGTHDDDDDANEKEQETTNVSATDTSQRNVGEDAETDAEIMTSNTSERTMSVPTTSMEIEAALSNLQLAPASEIAYFYLKDTIGLDESVMWKITYEAGSVLGLSVSNIETKVSLLTRLLNLSDADVRTILTKQPSILHLSANQNLSPTILFLVRSLEVSKAELRSIVCAYPAVLCYSISNLKAKLNFFTLDLDLDMAAVRNLLLKEPKLVCAAVPTGLQPRFHFLHKEMNIPLLDLQHMVKRNPKILLYSLEQNLQPKFLFLILHLKMTDKQILKLLRVFPEWMNYNLHHHISPIVQFFCQDIELSPMEVGQMSLKYPKLISHSLVKIKHVVGYLRYELEMDATQVKRVLFQAPQVVSLTDDRLLSKVQFIQNDLGFDEPQELRRIIAGMPTLLLCSVQDNLEPKATYLLNVLDNNETEFKQLLLKLPTIMGYSLEKRIKPRMNKLIKYGIPPSKIITAITFTEIKFEDWLETTRYKLEQRNLAIVADSRDISGETNGNAGNGENQNRSGRIIHWKR